MALSEVMIVSFSSSSNFTSPPAVKIFFFLSNLKFDAVIVFFLFTALELPLVTMVSSFLK